MTQPAIGDAIAVDPAAAIVAVIADMSADDPAVTLDPAGAADTVRLHPLAQLVDVLVMAREGEAWNDAAAPFAEAAEVDKWLAHGLATAETGHRPGATPAAPPVDVPIVRVAPAARWLLAACRGWAVL